MAMVEMDSFFFKFKNLLSSGKSANLTLRADAGKATITLTVEVEDLVHAVSKKTKKKKEESCSSPSNI